MSFKFDGKKFETVGSIRPDHSTSGIIKEYNYKTSIDRAGSQEFHDYASLQFCFFDIGRNWNFPGVFALELEQTLVYVGMSEDLGSTLGRERYGEIRFNHLKKKGGRVTACKLNNKILVATKSGLEVIVQFHKELDRPRRLELRSKIRDAYLPSWNG